MIQAKKILSQFSPQIENHVVEFCKHLSKTEADVYIVFARKAACFISVLEDVGLLTLKGTVVSERVLDYNTDWLKDKSVILVDDTIISGTSIYRTIQTLEKIGVKSISVQVFCVNKYWFVEDLLVKPTGGSYLSKPYVTLEHAASLKFCKEIVRAFSIHPRPYSTDFPIFESIILSEEDINKIESLHSWKIVGTTTQLQEDEGVRCFSMNPRRDILEKFFHTVGIELEKHSYLKFRVYAKQLEESAHKSIKYQCRILPLVIFEPTAHDLLDKLLSAICVSEKVEERFIKFHLTTNIAKLRFIQFYFAQRFFNFFVSEVSASLDRQLKFKTNRREIDLLFPPDLVTIVNRFEYQSQVVLDEKEFEHKFLTQQPGEDRPFTAANPYRITESLMDSFLKYYYEKEIEARRKVKSQGKAAFADPTAKKIINRLDDGHTFGDLKKILADNVPSDADQNIIISNFLDSTIDSGIVVPITIELEGFTCRGYRHGEEIIWGENNDKLLAVFYKTFLEKTEGFDMGHFWFEKSLVLFLKMGLKARILDEYSSSTAPPQSMHIMAVRSYLYGQVTVRYDLLPAHETKFNPILDYEIKGHWASQRLKDMGVLAEKGQRYILDTEGLYNYNQIGEKLSGEPDDLDPDLKSVAEEIGEILAITRSKKMVTLDDLVLLTSCLTIHDCIASIAAELYIYFENFSQLVAWMNAGLKDLHITTRFLTRMRDVNQNPAWTAVNSGCDKFINFKNKEGEKLVENVSVQLGKEKDGSFKRRAWDKYWKKEMVEDSTKTPDLSYMNHDIGYELIEINFLLNYLHSLIHEIVKRKGLIEPLIEGKLTNIKSKTNQLQRIRKKISSLQPGSDKKTPELSFENGEKIKELENTFEEIKREVESDQREVDYWNEFIEKNIERAKFYQHELKKDEKEISYQTEYIFLTTQHYQSLSEEEIITEIKKVMHALENCRSTAHGLLQDFSALVPQWGKINPIVRFNSIIHVNTSETNEDNRNQIKKVVQQCIDEFNKPDSSSTFKSAVILRPLAVRPNSGYYIGGKGKFIIDRITRLAAKLLQECIKLNMNFQIHFYPALDELNQIKAFYNKGRQETDEVHDDFYPKFEILENQFQTEERCLLIYNSSRGKTAEEYTGIIHKNITGNVKDQKLNYRSETGQTEELIKYNLNMTGTSSTMTIGVVTALPVEFAAMKASLDNIDGDFTKPSDDANDYIKGTIKNKKGNLVNVIVVLMKKTGNNLAAAAATHLLRTFPTIDDVIMCGIAGGVPNIDKPLDHVRLGDIVVSDKNGVLQYDNIKDDGTKITIRDTSSKPSARLTGFVNLLEADKILSVTPWNSFIDQIVSAYPAFSRPPESSDILNINGKAVCHPIDATRIAGYPKVFMGPIGSANTLLKNEKLRDSLRDDHNVKAIEMEGSGIADGTWEFSKGYLLVRGIVDYCNPDKGDDWHKYAAAVAAAYTKSIIEHL